MKHQPLVMAGIIAVCVVALVICVGMVSGYSVFKPFISVNPVSDKNAGDVFTVSGKTNLPAGTNLMVQIYATSFENHASDTGEFSGAMGTVDVKSGIGGINTWSMELNTSVFVPMEYLVNVSVITGDIRKGSSATGAPFGTTTFTVHPSLVSAASGQYILVDPIAGKTTGDLLIVTGSTNLAAGTSLMVDVGNFGGNTVVNAGTGGINRYSMPVDTSTLKPGILTVNVTEMTGDPAKGNYAPGSVLGSTTFTLGGTYLGSDTPVQVTPAASDYIAVNPIGARSTGDQFLITGTTSLPVGTSLIWQIMPDTGTAPTRVNKTAMGLGGSNMVAKGSGALNRVSFAADMNQMPAGKWVVLVGVMKSGDFEVENPIATASFTLN
jgi:hypothetical protein